MSRISDKFDALRRVGKKALIPYIMAGDPDMAVTSELILRMEKDGADIIELGVPFSDPLADGPTIQRAGIRALANGVKLRDVLSLVKDVRRKTQIPIILMLYYNLVFAHGEEKFVRDAISAGVDGVIIPDLPPEEAGNISAMAEKASFDIIFLLAPTSSEDRIRLIVEKSAGFIYYVSLTGVTGARRDLDKGIESAIRKIKKMTDKPVCCGFGISGPEQAARVAGWADGVIVGSAIVGLIEKSGKAVSVSKAGRFVKGLKQAIGG